MGNLSVGVDPMIAGSLTMVGRCCDLGRLSPIVCVDSGKALDEAVKENIRVDKGTPDGGVK